MKKKISKVLFSLAAILVALATWAYFWPSLTDKKELIAPKSFEEFYPFTGTTEAWERLFGLHSQHFPLSFDKMRESLDAEQIGDAIDPVVLDFLDAAYDLSQEKFDIPRTTPDKESGTDFVRFRDYIRFVSLLQTEENRAHYETALRLSETYMVRSKTLVDYMMALNALRLLQGRGAGSDIYVNKWRDALGRAVMAEYYFVRESGEISGRFLFQETKTWNDMWRFLTFIDESIANDDVKAMNERTESIVTAWMRWPYINLNGELFLVYCLIILCTYD